ncbi:uncharacterized protein LOC115752242 [Rhodamnia argentea]|uniref:Uncharacterized protein LOC115752242 n=1 Tax=Rhodamnia argentea TaxID=178133 RepID=A0A8B8QGJ3_9MYRT|nr:uncharacterized protein LOC115752242 [Rhodamnia argentea]
MAASTCMTSCIVDGDARMGLRYVSLRKGPGPGGDSLPAGLGWRSHPGVVDGISCRQMYLRSYPFSRKESVPERTKKCLGRVKKGVARGKLVVQRAKEVSCSAFLAIFHRLLSCTAKIDVADYHLSQGDY